jgi:protein required for attachment to host cells
MPPTRYPTWILVADAKSARVLTQDARNAPLALTEELQASPAAHARDLKSSAPGRAFTAGSPDRHAMEPRTDPLAHQKRQFARRLAELMNAAARRKRFRRLVLVAPPRMLGDLRAELDTAASRLVGAEIPHDHIRTPPDELLARLGDAL